MAFQRQTKPKSDKFQYRGRTADEMKKRATQSGGMRDSFFNPDVKFYAAAAGDNRIRILPPTWDEPEHFGFEIHVHYGIGPDNNAYLCADRMQSQTGVCPICRERAKAESAGDKEYADTLRASKRIATFVINRDKIAEGPLIWSMPWTIDRDICGRAVDKDTGEVYQLDNPYEGFDVMFKKEGTQKTTKYVSIEIARKPSPLSSDEKQMDTWLEYVSAHPIPSMLVFYDPTHIEKVFSGAQPTAQTPASEEKEAPAAPPFNSSAPARRPASKPAAEPEKEEPKVTWEEIHSLTEEELVSAIETMDIGNDLPEGAEDMELGKLQDAVCEVLGISAPVTAPATKGKTSMADRLNRLRPK